jgi:DNA-binding transcriptional LysR family regulator
LIAAKISLRKRKTLGRRFTPMQDLSWDDIKLAKAIADARGLSGAAQQLGVNHSTVFRRLGALEETLATKLFDRRRSGYTLTPAGEEILDLAQRMEVEVHSFARKLAGREASPAGELRVTTSDTLLLHLLTPMFARFRASYPDVRLDIILGNQALNLSKRDADVAIRATDQPPENLVGRRVAHIGWALYGPAADSSATALADDLFRRPWVSLGENFSGFKVVQQVLDRVPSDCLVYRINTVLGLAEAVEAGIGIGYLPCFIADTRPSLARLSATNPSFATDLWLLTHADLRHAPRVRAFMDFVAAEIIKQRPAIDGSQVAAPAPAA